MEILTTQLLVEDIYQISHDPNLDNLDLGKNGQPDLGHILKTWGLGSELNEPLSELAKNSNLQLTGGVARKLLGYEIPSIKSLDFLARPIQTVSGMSNYKAWETSTAARVIRNEQISEFDLDLLTDVPVNNPHVLNVAKESGLPYREKLNPNRLIVNNAWSKGLKISITQMPDENAKHSPPCTTLDEVAFRVDESLKIEVSQDFKEKDLSLDIVGFDKIATLPKSKQSQRIAINFITQSLTEKNGKKIKVNFGESKAHEELLLTWLCESTSQTITDACLGDQSSFDNNLYIRLLNVAQANWKFLDPKIQGVVINAFKSNFKYLSIASS